MNVCCACEKIFDKPCSWLEAHGERRYGCPDCRSGFVEAKKCELCDEYYDAENANQRSLCCDACEEDLTSRFSKLLKDNFTEYEITILNSIYDGRDLK